jgi:hypothetical protein
LSMVSSSPYRIAIIERILRNLFLINLMIFVPLSLIGQEYAQAATPSSYSLVGTIRGGDFSGAVINVEKGKQSFFRLLDKLPDGSQIIKIRADSIVLRGSDGLTYDMYILHETRNVAAVPFSALDPFAGATRRPPSKRRLTPYEKGRLRRLGKHALDDE